MSIYSKIGSKITEAIICRRVSRLAEQSVQGLSEWSTKQVEKLSEENVRQERKKVPCKFVDGISYEEFCSIAKDVAHKMERIVEIEIIGLQIYCTVESITRKTDWSFSVDFNDWGHLTGGFWRTSENMDSSIPLEYGMEVSGKVNALLKNKNITLIDYDDVVKSDKEAGNLYDFNKRAKKSLAAKLFKRKLVLSNSTSDLIGEHLFVTLALLKRDGFTNVKIFPVDDLKENRNKYDFEVEQVVIDGNSYVEKGEYFSTNAEVFISYHVYEIDKETKKELRKTKRKAFVRKHIKKILLIATVIIVMILASFGKNYYEKLIPVTFSYDSIINEPYIEVEEKLKVAGFTNITFQPVHTLNINELNKENLVASVIINDDDYFAETSKYPYDCDIVIYYYAAKMINPPILQKDAKGMNYQEVAKQFEQAGFGNITLNPEKDLIIGLFNDEGQVSTITINGDDNYEESMMYRVDSIVVISYHSYK